MTQAQRTHRRLAGIEGAVPFVVLVGAWFLAPHLLTYPEYLLPPVQGILERAVETTRDMTLPLYTAQSLLRLLAGLILGNAVAVPLAIAIALNQRVSDLLLPLLAFLQSIAGIAWIPLAIIWFGIGNGAVIFVVANIIFFSMIYNTIIGIQSIPLAIRRAVLCHGGRGVDILTVLILPGALVQIILGLRTSVALGWRALVAAEMLAGTGGLGYMTLEAVQWYRTDTVIMGMLLIGILWLIIDRLIFLPLENATVVRWGIVQR